MVRVLEAVCDAHDDPHPGSPVEMLKFFDCNIGAFKLQANKYAYERGGYAKVKSLTVKML